MGLFPQSFIEDLKSQADIVRVVQDYVPLRKAGTSYKGLCPFHSEKTPSFHVNGDKSFFHCFGCGVGGDVFKFLELKDKVGFQDAVRQLAQRFGVPVPETQEGRPDAVAETERVALLKMQEIAGEFFRSQLAERTGIRTRQRLDERGLSPEIIDTIGFGFAPNTRDGLTTRLREQGFSVPLMLRSGLVVEREPGMIRDRFRGRLMIPICRDGGSIVAFGGRALDPDQQPKYLNSPETPIYSKSRTLYGLHITKSAIRQLGYAVLVEGYFDFAQTLQAGITSVVASCGTALTAQQSRLLRRFTAKAVLSFDADAAGQSATARSGQLLLSDGFQVNVALLPPGEDPDTFVQKHGGSQYLEKLRSSRPYLEFLLDRAAAERDFSRDDSRREFLNEMLAVAADIPDAAVRDQFADRLAHKARVMEEVVRTEIRRAAVARRTTLEDRERPGSQHVRTAEKGLIWALVHEPATALAALAELDEGDFEGLATGAILVAARSLREWPIEAVPKTFLERLNEGEAAIVSSITGDTVAPAQPADCGRTLKRLRYEHERAAVQEEINRLQQLGTDDDMAQIDQLWRRKKDLLIRIEALNP